MGGKVVGAKGVEALVLYDASPRKAKAVARAAYAAAR